jgi:peptidoglycan/LPS O-acetylase OafA/YrhL
VDEVHITTRSKTLFLYIISMTKRNWGIDCLRGMSILLVMLNHLGLGFRLPLKQSVLIDYVPLRVLSALSFNGYESVFIFFVISGFLIASKALSQHANLQALDWRAFYVRRASRILPLLLALLGVLTLLHLAGFADYRIQEPGQSLGGALLSALGLYLNWYEGQTTWLPASWDVLWSLSIEEVFYLAFPLVCLLLPRKMLLIGLALLALSLPFTKAALQGNEIWSEKAYLPGMSAIAIGVLAAFVAQLWTHQSSRTARMFLVLGLAGVLGTLLWGDFIWRSIAHANMLVLTLGVAAWLLACHYLCKQAHAPRGLGWLAHMGQLSYEIYISHMFVVLSTVALFRHFYAPNLRWDFVVYIPCIALCVWIGKALQRWLTLPCERYFRRARTIAASP